MKLLLVKGRWMRNVAMFILLMKWMFQFLQWGCIAETELKLIEVQIGDITVSDKRKYNNVGIIEKI